MSPHNPPNQSGPCSVEIESPTLDQHKAVVRYWVHYGIEWAGRWVYGRNTPLAGQPCEAVITEWAP